MEKKSFDGNGCIVYRFLAFTSEAIPDFAAITIDTISDAIDESILLSLYFHYRQVLYILVDRKRFFLVYVTGEVIAASYRVVEDGAGIGNGFGIVDKSIEGSVSTCYDYRVSFLDLFIKEAVIILDFCNIQKCSLLVFIDILQLACLLITLVVSSHGVIENIYHWNNPPVCSLTWVSIY